MTPARALRALAAFAAVLGFALPAAAQTTLRINIALAQNSHYGVAIDSFAREVERRTGGRYKVQTFYSSALGAERESVEGVQLGTLDLTLTSTGPLPNFVPEVAILDIAVADGDLPVRSKLDSIRRIHIDHLHLPAQSFSFRETRHGIQGVPQHHAIRPIRAVLVELDEFQGVETIEVLE